MRVPRIFLCVAVAAIPTTGLARAATIPSSPGQQPVPTRPAPAVAGQAAPVPEQPVARRITVEEVKKRMDAGQKVVIIDTRGTFAGPRVTGSTHVPADKLDAWAKDVPKNTFIVAYCT